MSKISIIVVVFTMSLGFAQKKELTWLSFEELEQALIVQPKKVMIHFYADWCVYCKKMDEAVFTKPEIMQELEGNYYAVRFNVETKDTISFGGKYFTNKNIGKKRMAFHQIPELLAGRINRTIELPATVILDKKFNVEQRFYRYIPPKEMLAILKSK